MRMGGASSCSQLKQEGVTRVRAVTSFSNSSFVLNRATEEPRRSSFFSSGDEIAFQTAMQLKIRTKFTYGFLVLAFGATFPSGRVANTVFTNALPGPRVPVCDALWQNAGLP